MNKVEQLLNNIDDPKLKERLEDIVKGRYTHVIKCQSKKCKGRIMGHLNKQGEVVPYTNKVGKMYLRASRKRLDGYMGFECWCGNDSRLAEHEKGIITAAMPKKTDLEKVWDRLQSKPTNYKEKNGKINIDNFLIETI